MWLSYIISNGGQGSNVCIAVTAVSVTSKALKVLAAFKKQSFVPIKKSFVPKVKVAGDNALEKHYLECQSP